MRACLCVRESVFVIACECMLAVIYFGVITFLSFSFSLSYLHLQSIEFSLDFRACGMGMHCVCLIDWFVRSFVCLFAFVCLFVLLFIFWLLYYFFWFPCSHLRFLFYTLCLVYKFIHVFLTHTLLFCFNNTVALCWLICLLFFSVTPIFGSLG